MLLVMCAFFFICMMITNDPNWSPGSLKDRLRSACPGLYLRSELPIMVTIPENTTGVSVGHVLRSMRGEKVLVEGHHLG